jgi:two-component system, cell cycle response regulator DivK
MESPAGIHESPTPARERFDMTKEISGRTIMVVEDYDDTRMLLKQYLEGLGYSVLEASNGQEAVDIANHEHPDLILMDLDLPILDGIAATQQIRQQTELDKVPIVAVTAYPLSYSHVKAFAKGCNEYMAKPIDMTELERLVNRYLSPQ